MAEGEKEPGMRLVEGLKRRHLLEKRMDDTAGEIASYASKVSSDVAAFGSVDAQRKEVAGRIQANLDLAEDLLKLSRRIELTNRQTSITIDGQTRPLSDWLILQRTLGDRIRATFLALNTKTGDRRRAEMRGVGPDNAAVHVDRMYDEAEKNKKLRAWEDRLEKISGRLERVNADTVLVD